jgi:predicted phosphoadenosine phosphosulfate sulfurtransferase
MQQELFIEQEDFSDEKVMIVLSGGINSAAFLIWLSQYPKELHPKELHLFYAHFSEHSPDTFPFVKELIRFARANFENVFVKITRNSVLRFFEERKMIPHPSFSPYTIILKILPQQEYATNHEITTDLVGYVREEIRRVKRMAKRTKSKIEHRSVITSTGLTKHFPISDKNNNWCFQIVKKFIGWYPKIYSIKYKGKRLFKHNNCLPCKNMTADEMRFVEFYFPELYEHAMKLSEKLTKYWGRDKVGFYTTFGRTDEELINGGCEVCKFD